MLHFPSTLKGSGSNGVPRRSDSLNATQQKAASHQIFQTVEEELHDARRVHAHGQEEDLRAALNMVINRVSELSTMLSEAYKTQADLEVQLNVAKSNLQLVISNNEMLEEALRRDTSGNPKDVGWRRISSKEGEQRSSDERPHVERTNSIDSTTSAAATSPTTAAPDRSFFRFRFASSASNSRQTSRPGTPSPVLPQTAFNQQSPTLPQVPTEAQQKLTKELEELQAELEKERAAHNKAKKEKEGLEAELESLSQALFEEANKMVATERIKRAETEEELREARLEKEALQSALKLIEGENRHLRSGSGSMPPSQTHSPAGTPPRTPPPRSRSSSRIGIKSLPTSPQTINEATFSMILSPSELPPLPPSPPASTEQKDSDEDIVGSYQGPDNDEDDDIPVAQLKYQQPSQVEPSPWATAATSERITPAHRAPSPISGTTIYAAAIYSTH